MINYPGRAVTLGVSLSDGRVWRTATVRSTPPQSKLLGTAAVLGVRRDMQFTPDVSGIYVLTTNENTEITVTVAEKLTKTIGTGADTATLTLWIDNGVVISEVPPNLSAPSSSIATQAIADSTVVAAAAALTGKTGFQVTATYFPVLLNAWAAAIANPAPTPAGLDPQAAAMVSAGWSRT